MNHPMRTDVRSDQVGKVFRVLGRDMRLCLICDELFTRHAAASHGNTAYLPTQRSFDRVGDIKNANR